MQKTQAVTKLKDDPLILSTDITQFLSGNTISYKEFCQELVRNKTLTTEVYDPIFNKRAFQVYEQLKEIAAE